MADDLLETPEPATVPASDQPASDQLAQGRHTGQAAHPRRPGFSSRPATAGDPAVFGIDEVEYPTAFFAAEGYVIVRGLYDEATLVGWTRRWPASRTNW